MKSLEQKHLLKQAFYSQVYLSKFFHLKFGTKPMCHK